jgi:uncharacterized LabA/DUF88 family protein
VSKNVAVFVDVANIFYAAKAAGVDIDYVTLLKSAVAGRDFVRAYAYTGLDPDNENQRQFHSFLARNGYKVVSKDIRKYGDGRIKANLDIELVVDLMRLARNLDIAVVVSGDGDFAPAIRAVQQMGVRVEVISFRGNTSSDLIEVADAFTDIAQVARVDKSSARSGRRVAAEGDLSMTEVPEKETEGVPRRQRSRRTTERAAATTAAAAEAAGLVVLPGERLSRAGEDGAAPVVLEAAELEAAEPIELPVAEAGEEAAGGEEATDGELADESRRRRRRRGGRGRGRGRRGEEAASGLPALPEDELEEGEEADDFEEVRPAQAPHHTFGSVWDSQLGVPSAPLGTASADIYEDEEDLEEPEVPEYLLAERRQRGQRGQRGRTGRRAGYQAALDRERFGRSPTSMGYGSRPPERPRGDRQRGGRQAPRTPRPERQQQPRPQSRPADQSATPWSEVPPEVEELLRAELARKQAVPIDEAAPAEPVGTVAKVGETETPAAKPKRTTTRRRTTKAAAGEEPAAQDGPAAQGEPATEEMPAAKPKPATTRRRTTKAATEEAPAAEEKTTAKPKRTTTRRRTTKATTEAEAGPSPEPTEES